MSFSDLPPEVQAHHNLTHGFCRHGELPGQCDSLPELDTRPKYVYVASSWRCEMQTAVVHVLRAAGIQCYDFKNPEEGTGFHWSEVMDDSEYYANMAETDAYLKALGNPRSIDGFNSDFDAMKRADTFVLVLPCGRSAHLEAGWAIGQGKRTAILLDPDASGLVTPELMYKMADYIAPSMVDLLGWLGIG
jgi:hypothetical protein